MTISSLKELQALIRMVKKEGIESMSVDGIQFYINPNLIKTDKQRQKPVNPSLMFNDLAPEADMKIPHYNPTPDVIDTDELTDEQLLMWSANAGSAGLQEDKQ